MREGIRVSDRIIDVVRGRFEMIEGIKLTGHVIAEARDINGKLLWTDEGDNLITNQYLTRIRDTMYGLNSPPAVDTQTYVGLFSSNYTPAATITGDTSTWAAASLTEAAHSGYARQEYIEAASGSYAVSNSASKASFTFPGTGGPWDIYGAFVHALVSAGGASDLMYAIRRFTTSPRTLQQNDVLEITYNFTFA